MSVTVTDTDIVVICGFFW